MGTYAIVGGPARPYCDKEQGDGHHQTSRRCTWCPRTTVRTIVTQGSVPDAISEVAVSSTAIGRGR